MLESRIDVDSTRSISHPSEEVRDLPDVGPSAAWYPIAMSDGSPPPYRSGMATGVGVVLARRARARASPTSCTPAARALPVLGLWSLLTLPVAIGTGLVLGAGNATWGTGWVRGCSGGCARIAELDRAVAAVLIAAAVLGGVLALGVAQARGRARRRRPAQERRRAAARRGRRRRSCRCSRSARCRCYRVTRRDHGASSRRSARCRAWSCSSSAASARSCSRPACS